MNDNERIAIRLRRAVLAAAIFSMIGLAGPALADEITVALSGNQEIPPVTTSATGTGTLTIGPDKSISGKVTVSGINVTMAHIHEASSGANGPVTIPLTKTSENVWAVPTGVKLTDAQFDAYKAGRLYFNIHSEAYRSGEIRGQIKP